MRQVVGETGISGRQAVRETCSKGDRQSVRQAVGVTGGKGNRQQGTGGNGDRR